MKKIILSSKLFDTIIAEASKDKSIGRTLMNYSLKEVDVGGDMTDLGAGSDSSSYMRFLSLKKPYKITYTDFYSNKPNVIKLDLEKKFDIPDGSYGAVLCFNVLEHIYDFRNTISESHRILRKSGRLILSVPFLVNYHPSPKDYFRYTHEAILRLLEEERFVQEGIVFLGFGPFSVWCENALGLFPKPARPIFASVSVIFDLILDRVYPSNFKFPLGYLFVFRKKSG